MPSPIFFHVQRINHSTFWNFKEKREISMDKGVWRIFSKAEGYFNSSNTNSPEGWNAYVLIPVSNQQSHELIDGPRIKWWREVGIFCKQSS